MKERANWSRGVLLKLKNGGFMVADDVRGLPQKELDELEGSYSDCHYLIDDSGQPVMVENGGNVYRVVDGRLEFLLGTGE